MTNLDSILKSRNRGQWNSRAGAFWAQTEFTSGCGAASPSQGPWDPDSLRPALRLGGQATAWEGSPSWAAGAELLPGQGGRGVELEA